MNTETQASGLALSVVREYAERVGRHYMIYNVDGCANLDSLVFTLGGRVEVAGGPESLYVRQQGDFTISIPMTTSVRRDRFTIAHEIGHYFLHYVFLKRKGEARFGRGLTNRAETEANTFASSLLMPAAEFARAHGTLSGDTYSLAELFEVSPRAAEVRCSVLRLAAG